MRSFHATLFAILLLPCVGFAQQEPAPAGQQAPETATQPAEQAPPKETGLTAFVQMGGSRTSLGAVTGVDVDLGFNFTKHLGADVGLPFYFVRTPFSLVATSDWKYWTLWGDPYIDIRYTTSRRGFDYTTVLTGEIPMGNNRSIYSTGRFMGDWFNHLERDVQGFTPFLNFGAGNGTVERFIMPRPYSMYRPYETLGFISDFEGGVSRKFFKKYTVGVSGYALVPAGPQNVYSKFVQPSSIVYGDGQHYRYFDSNFETQFPIQVPAVAALVGSGTYDGCTLIANVTTCKGGLSSIAKDDGYSAWIEVARQRNVSVQIGYTRSIHYALDIVTLMIHFNATPLLREVTGIK